MSLYKLIGVPCMTGVPGFELFFDDDKAAHEAFTAADAAVNEDVDVGIADSFGSKVSFIGSHFAFFMLQDVDKACDGKNEEQLCQMRAQKRGQTLVQRDPVLNGPGLITVPSAVMDGPLRNGVMQGRG